MTLVDLIFVEKSSLFGALSITLTFDDRIKHGQMRTKDDVSKKWLNWIICVSFLLPQS